MVIQVQEMQLIIIHEILYEAMTISESCCLDHRANTLEMEGLQELSQAQ